MASASTTRLLKPLTLPIPSGAIEIDPPVVLAPMAGITNAAFRLLCREQGAGLFVSEMVTARALIERNEETMRMITPGKGEFPRSIQLYAVDPRVAGLAVQMLGRENLADHIDMNFGCPVPKVTRKGGGAALPYKRELFKEIVGSVVKNAAQFNIPVTVKMRIGIDDDHKTFIEAGKNAAQLGVSWVALHARTAAQMYSGNAQWSAISELVEALEPYGTPVLGNGDIWSGADGLRMVSESGCHGVVVGRGCLGRPWLFAELVAAFEGKAAPEPPTLRKVAEIMVRHGELLSEYFEDEFRAARDLRKHMAWYLKGFRVGSEIRSQLAMINNFAEMKNLLDQIEEQPYPQEIGEAPRGRSSGVRQVSLPHRWLEDPDEIPAIALDDSVSGG
ncbi:MAG: tRNA dihydrouridine synthase DusB [Candidatus Nanopelagicaceae bacterium]